MVHAMVVVELLKNVPWREPEDADFSDLHEKEQNIRD
jgi:hypothetical protein